MSAQEQGWKQLLEGYPWFAGEGRFPLAAYSENMPPPRLARSPYGAHDENLFRDDDPFGWQVTEIEEEYELRPGFDMLAQRLVAELIRLNQGLPVHPIAGHHSENLQNNPYWSAELAGAKLQHERFVLLLPLALSRTQDDRGRIRWTLFGSSDQGPEHAFWKSFFTAPDREVSQEELSGFIIQLLKQAYQERIDDPTQLKAAGFRILASEQVPGKDLPAWTEPFRCDEHNVSDDVRYLLTFQPFSQLPETVRSRYLAGNLHLLPSPLSLVFWGMPTYRKLQNELPLAMQIPLLRMLERGGRARGLRIPQSGWLHEPHPKLDPATIQQELIRNTYARSSRWSRTHRYSDELDINPRVDKMSKVLFSTALDVMGLYDKPMARNIQIWTRDFQLLLDGPSATIEQLRKAELAFIEGGLFGYRFVFPAMRIGLHEVYWQRPLIAFAGQDGSIKALEEAPLGYLTAYRDGKPDVQVELWPRLLRRDLYLSALHDFESKHDHYEHHTALNILSILDSSEQIGDRRLSRSFARDLLRIASDESLETWLGSLPERSRVQQIGERMRTALEEKIEPTEAKLPEAITYQRTATRTFEEAWWNDIAFLSHGKYVNKDNADVVLDPATRSRLKHHQRDLEPLGDYLLGRYRKAIAEAGMEGKAVCGELPFRWETDFDFTDYDGWRLNQENRSYERNLLVVIPGKNRGQAVVMGDHYDTAYMEDLYETARGGSGERLSAAGADDNHSATATLLQAAPIFLEMAKAGSLERDVWLLHLTGEEFPSDCMGARNFSRLLVEGGLTLHYDDGKRLDLSSTRVTGLLVMDMIAHNRDSARDIFQISPGRSREALLVAEQAHLANRIWNANVETWNRNPDRCGKGRGKRSADGKTIPAVAHHLSLHGDVRTIDDPMSSLYNTDGQIFSDVGIPAILFMENYDINRQGYHDTHDTLENIDLDYGSAVAAIAIETIARLAR